MLSEFGTKEGRMIANATAWYTGGGIYIYTGETTSGDYFMTNDEAEDYVGFYNADTANLDESDYEDWQIAHRIGEYEGQDARDFTRKILEWIITNKPYGNYATGELEIRLSRLG